MAKQIVGARGRSKTVAIVSTVSRVLVVTVAIVSTVLDFRGGGIIPVFAVVARGTIVLTVLDLSANSFL